MISCMYMYIPVIRLPLYRNYTKRLPYLNTLSLKQLYILFFKRYSDIFASRYMHDTSCCVTGK